MPCTIISNNIYLPEKREAVNAAIRAGIGERTGDWRVVVYEPPDFPAVAARIEGPKQLRFSWTFLEGEQTPQFIEDRVAKGIRG